MSNTPSCFATMHKIFLKISICFSFLLVRSWQTCNYIPTLSKLLATKYVHDWTTTVFDRNRDPSSSRKDCLYCPMLLFNLSQMMISKNPKSFYYLDCLIKETNFHLLFLVIKLLFLCSCEVNNSAVLNYSELRLVLR